MRVCTWGVHTCGKPQTFKKNIAFKNVQGCRMAVAATTHIYRCTVTGMSVQTRAGHARITQVTSSFLNMIFTFMKNLFDSCWVLSVSISTMREHTIYANSFLA